jgi:valyl-tRNA synthetase
VLPRSQRNDSIVEPMISTQWFVRMAPLAEPALAAVREGRTKIIPEEWAKTYEHWMTNILDWCISRQLWWGHRIPAWHCAACGHVTVVNAEHLDACAKCASDRIEQDPDVLDTWFSSGLWPFSTLGWPDDTPALRKFYPASDLETGYDILFFWVARMMMMGIHFMGAPPFERVLLHGLVVDETGDKMSKVKGNVIDPLDLIQGASFDEVVDKALPGAPRDEAQKKFKKAYPSAAQMGAGFAASGADALRFTLATYSPQSKRIPLSPKKLEGNRNFCNKIWNATRYSLGYLEGAKVTHAPPPATLLPNRWILSRLAAAAAVARTGIDEFRLDDAALGLYHFFWGELCDWYLEITKPIFAGGGPGAAETRDVLAHVLEAALRLLHPFVPFITEELWQRLPRPAGSPVSIALAPYPGEGADRAARDVEAERDMAVLQAAIGAARTVRAEHDLPRSNELPLTLRADEERVIALLRAEEAAIRFLVNTAGPPVIEARGAARPKGWVMHVAADIEVLVRLVGLVDPAKDTARVEREIRKVEKDLLALEKKLALPSFADKAPPEVVAETKAQMDELRRKRAALDEARQIAAELGEGA